MVSSACFPLSGHSTHLYGTYLEKRGKLLPFDFDPARARECARTGVTQYPSNLKGKPQARTAYHVHI